MSAADILDLIKVVGVGGVATFAAYVFLTKQWFPWYTSQEAARAESARQEKQGYLDALKQNSEVNRTVALAIQSVNDSLRAMHGDEINSTLEKHHEFSTKEHADIKDGIRTLDATIVRRFDRLEEIVRK